MTREVAKSQWVRIWDIFGLAPLQIYIGLKYDMHPFERLFMVGAGLGTLLFNLKFLLEDRDASKAPYPQVAAGMSTVYTYPKQPDRKLMGNNMRLMDIFFYGPMLLWVAQKYRMDTWEELFTWYAGISTIYLNGKNYLANKGEANV